MCYHDVAATVRMKGPEQSIYMHRWHEQRNTFLVVYHTHLAQQLLPAITQTQHLLHRGQHHTQTGKARPAPTSPPSSTAQLTLLVSTVSLCWAMCAVTITAVLVMASNLKS